MVVRDDTNAALLGALRFRSGIRSEGRPEAGSIPGAFAEFVREAAKGLVVTLAALAVLALAGCGDDVVVPPADGGAEVAAADGGAK